MPRWYVCNLSNTQEKTSETGQRAFFKPRERSSITVQVNCLQGRFKFNVLEEGQITPSLNHSMCFWILSMLLSFWCCFLDFRDRVISIQAVLIRCRSMRDTNTSIVQNMPNILSRKQKIQVDSLGTDKEEDKVSDVW